MTFTVTSKTVKPADAKWFNQVDTVAGEKIGKFVSTYPGVVSVTASEIEPNVWQSVIVFESKAVQEAFRAALAHLSETALRKAYNDTHGLTTTFTSAGE